MLLPVEEIRAALGPLADGRSDAELVEWATVLEWVAELSIDAALEHGEREDAPLRRTA